MRPPGSRAITRSSRRGDSDFVGFVGFVRWEAEQRTRKQCRGLPQLELLYRLLACAGGCGWAVTVTSKLAPRGAAVKARESQARQIPRLSLASASTSASGQASRIKCRYDTVADDQQVHKCDKLALQRRRRARGRGRSSLRERGPSK